MSLGGRFRGVGVESSRVSVRCVRFVLFIFLRHRPTRRLGVVIEVVAPGLATVCSRCICAGVGFNPLRDPQGVVLFRGVSVPSCVVVVVSVVVVIVFFGEGVELDAAPWRVRSPIDASNAFWHQGSVSIFVLRCFDGFIHLKTPDQSDAFCFVLVDGS